MATTRSTRDRDALIHYRALGDAELGALHDALRYEVADVAGLYDGDATVRLLLDAYERAASEEIARRQRLHRAGANVPNPFDRRYQAWVDLAREVRQQADIIRVFADGGYWLKQTGVNEWHGQCFVCGEGRDRLLVRTDPPGRYWCRRCGLTGDVISAARNLLGPAAGQPLDFVAAVTHLARQVGLPTPDERSLLPATTPSAVGARPRREGIIRVG